MFNTNNLIQNLKKKQIQRVDSGNYPAPEKHKLEDTFKSTEILINFMYLCVHCATVLSRKILDQDSGLADPEYLMTRIGGKKT